VDPATTGSTWVNSFVETEGMTVVTTDIRCDSLAHLEAQIKMGFKEGLTACLDNLDEVLARLHTDTERDQ
jgi:PhnB protein